MTEFRQNEEMLRTLTHRAVQAQETERGRVALELHDHITQLLCAILLHCQVLVAKLSGPVKVEALKIRAMLSQAAEEVERISRNLRPGVLDELGLVAVLRETSADFAKRTGIALKLTSMQLTLRLSAGVELALYRILQETLRNVEKHAQASHVTVRLKKVGDGVQLTIKDDGIGFDLPSRPTGSKRKLGLGLLSMRERATAVGGVLTIKSSRRAGTEIAVRISQPGSLSNVAPIRKHRRAPAKLRKNTK